MNHAYLAPRADSDSEQSAALTAAELGRGAKLRHAVADCRFYGCTLMREPTGGWIVAPLDGGPAFIGSLTLYVDTLGEAVDHARRVYHKRDERY